MDKKGIKEFVRKRYARVASGSCCGPVAPLTAHLRAETIGYSSEDLKGLPTSAVEIASGCGNPVASADLRGGEVVLDLGSGGGIDVLLVAKKVGQKGRVVGVDMTPEMIEKARESVEKMGLQNVEFKLGEIEELPIRDESVDVVISNCVINLSPDKAKAFREAYRVLKNGGRMVISDIVTQGGLPKPVRESTEAWAGCVAGALKDEGYLERIREAGFEDVEVLSTSTSCCGPRLSNVYRIKVRARKP